MANREQKSNREKRKNPRQTRTPRTSLRRPLSQHLHSGGKPPKGKCRAESQTDFTRKATPVTVNDRMQRGYCYRRTEPPGRNFDPEFKPELTPKLMLALGIFGGKYMTDCKREFPADWFLHAREAFAEEKKDPSHPLNYFWRRCEASRFPNGRRKAGFIQTIRAAGFNGIAATGWAAATRTTRARSNAGNKFAATSAKSKRIVNPAICIAVRVSARPCCIGRMTAAKSKATHRLLR